MAYVTHRNTQYWAILLGSDGRTIERGPNRLSRAAADLDALELVIKWGHP